jgi:3-hydroxybutyryl-CoA dehydrogenase
MKARAPIACLGAGRMGRGIAVVFAYAGHPISLVDFKVRSPEDFAQLRKETINEIRDSLRMLSQFGLFKGAMVEAIAARVSITSMAQAQAALAKAAIIFEGVPEVLDLKRDVLARASKLAGSHPIIASTTSTILVDDLSSAVERPERFLNAHWLNPAFLMPLVELSPGASTDPAIVARLKTLLESIGKVPVVCAARPGYIVPRIQTLAMNEAARMVEEGVASAEDIDKAIKYGFGIRYAVLGMLEFIDWGGGDILYYASRYLTGALKNDRYQAPDIIERNMREGRTGLRAGKGFLDYEARDLRAYRRERLGAFAALLGHFGLTKPPALPPRSDRPKVNRKRPAVRRRARQPSRRR